MATAVEKKTFSIKKDIASQLDMYKNKSKFVNEALVFYIAYLESAKHHKKDFLEKSMIEPLYGSEEVLDTKDHNDFISLLRSA